MDTLIFGVVQHFLPERWSSLQIAGTLKVIWPDAPQRTLSHEATYNCIHAMHRGQLRKELIACLHRVQGKRMLRPRGQDRRGQLLDALSIHVRPPEAKERAFPVQWEGDLIKGACDRSALNVLGGRSSREVMLVKMANATAVSALEGFPAKMRSIAEPDAPDVDVRPRQGDGRRTELTLNMGILMYFCDQHSFWQRGSCEKEIIS